MADGLHLSERHRGNLLELIRQHLPNVEVWAYGSRVNGRSHDGSDLDLVLRGTELEKIPAEQLTDFEEALRESSIPFLVEARDWARLPESFHREIEREHFLFVAGDDSEHDHRSGRLLRDHAEIVMGQSPSGSTCNALGDGVPLLNGPTEFGPHHPTPIQFTTEPKKRARSGDVLFCVRGSTTGRMNWADQDYAIGRGIAAIRHSDHCYLQQFLRGVVEQNLPSLLVQATGSTFPNVSAEQLGMIPWPSLELEEQHAIAEILGTLDDKIELNRRMNETLETIAHGIFKDWFVDFGPTRAKAEGRAPYLPPELWELFPAAFDNEGKPTGWQMYTLSDLVHHHRATLSPSAHPDCIYEHYSIPAYDAGNEPAIDLGDSIKSNKTIVPQGAVLLSKINPEIERVWLPNTNSGAPRIASTEFLALTPLAPATSSVLYCLFRSSYFRAQMTARVTGTSKSHQRVPPKSLLACEVLVANPTLLDMFDRKVSPMMNRLLSNRRESSELVKTRDVLLPKLVSGEIHLQDAEKIVESAA
ncbi:MAG: restriction endonuclease subunit S [Gammaproteobacteria bacterium]|nr:restriction endonuclease subunit S [Gammaproteobacteria bacterium]